MRHGEGAWVWVVPIVPVALSVLWQVCLERQRRQERVHDKENMDAERLADLNDQTEREEAHGNSGETVAFASQMRPEATVDVDGTDGNTGLRQSMNDCVETETSRPRHKLTFVSHAGEDKTFVRDLLKGIEEASCAAFFDDDMAVGTRAGNEMTSRAKEADQAVVVLSRPFLTKKWPMKELNIFLKNGVKLYPLYYGVTPDELSNIVTTYDRQASEDKIAFRDKMKSEPEAWRALMDKTALSTRAADFASLPDPVYWRDDVGALAELTGLRRSDFGEDDAGYVKAIAGMLSPPRLPDTVPSLPDQFVKPSLVDSVISELLDSSPGTSRGSVVLTGIGGAGKSVIASAVARDKGVRRHFSDGVLWINDDPQEFNETKLLIQLKTLAKQFRELVLARHYRQGHAFQYDVPHFKDLRDVQEFFPMWQKKYDLQCLLVVDSAWTVEVLEATGIMGFQVLSTTRKEHAIPSSREWRLIPVPPLGEDDALLVLKNYSRSPIPLPRESALQVAKDCAFLPLALAIAASMPPVEGAPSPTDAWRKLHDKLEDKAKMQHITSGQRDSLNTVLAVSVNELGRWQRSHFLKLAVIASGVLASKEMLLYLWEEDLADAEVAAKDLVNRSLMQKRGDAFQVHDLLLDFAKGEINSERFGTIKEAATSRQAQYLGRPDVVHTYSDNGEVDGGVYSLMALWRSLEELSGDPGLEVKTYTNSLVDLEGSEATFDAATTYGAVARLFDLQGNYAEAKRLYKGAMNANEKVHGPDHPEVAANINNLAVVLLAQGEYVEAEPLLARATAIWEKVLGSEHVDVAIALTNSAEILREQGRYKEAYPLQARALTIFETALGEEHHLIAAVLNNQAQLLKAQGNFAEAASMAARAMKMWETVLGPEHPHVASALLNEAALLRELGKYAEAGPLCERALAIDEKVYGKTHPQVAFDVTNLAALLEAQAKYSEAQPFFERGQAIMERALGEDHPKSMLCRAWMAKLYMKLGSLDKAVCLLREVVSDTERTRGLKHPAVALALSNLAVVLYQQANYAEAEPLFEQCITIQEQSLGLEHPELANSLYSQAELYKSQGRHTEAKALYERSLAIREQALGSDHPDVAQSLNSQAVMLESQEKYAEAEPLYERALAIREKALGPDHPDVAMVLNNQAVLKNAQGKSEEAEPLYARAIAIGRKSLGSDHPDMALWRSNLALLFKRRGNLVEAEQLYAAACASAEKSLGPEHPHVAVLLSNRAGLFKAQGNHDEAERLYNRVLAIDETVYGHNHPEVATDLLNIAMLLEKQGRVTAAESLYARAVGILMETQGPGHPKLAIALSNWSTLLMTQGKHSEAVPLLEGAVAAMKETHGADNESTVTLRRLLKHAQAQVASNVSEKPASRPQG